MKDELIEQLSNEYEAAKDLATELLPVPSTGEDQDAYYKLLESLKSLRDLAIKFGESSPYLNGEGSGAPGLGVRFFTKITARYVIKNKLHEDLAIIAEEMDAKILVGSDALEDYLSNFRRRVKLANSNHPRCKPVELTIYHPGDLDTQYIVYVSGLFHMNIWKEEPEHACQSKSPSPSGEGAQRADEEPKQLKS